MTWQISVSEFARIHRAVVDAGYGEDIKWSQRLAEPATSDAFAREAIFVICNSGMRFTVAQGIFDRVMEFVTSGRSARGAFGHIGKTTAIDAIWHHREALFREFLGAPNKVEYCQRLPWIGGITKYHLAKNLGVDVAKPDVHLQRLAAAANDTVHGLCARLAVETGLRIATVDVVLWRACAIGIINSRELQVAA